MNTNTRKPQPSIEEKTARLAKSIATRMDRGSRVHSDEMEQLKMLTKLLIEKKRE